MIDFSDINTTVRVETKKEIKLNALDIRELIQASGGPVIPMHSSIYVTIPGGGDWSNEDLEISPENPVVISWTEVTINDEV